jgi:peptidyl-prolyl cis-trans isomerase D
MLQNIREKLTSPIAIVVMAIMAIPFLFFGVDYSFTRAGYAVEVNGVEIPARAVQQEYQAQLARFQQFGEIPEQLVPQIQAQAYESVIARTLLDQYLQERGYRVSDEQVLRSISEIPQFQVDGQFSPQAYRETLQVQGIPLSRFENEQRQNLRLNQFQSGIVGTAFVTPSEVRRVIELQNEQREIDYLTIDPDAFSDEVTVTDADVASWYESRPELYTTPETASLRYVQIDADTAVARLELSDDTLREYFESVSDQFVTPEQRRPSHILLRTDDDEAAARDLAESLLARIRAGEPFEDLARQYSTDTGSAREGGDLGWVSRGDFVGPVEDAVFSMTVGEVSDIVESDFGLHIIRLDDVREGSIPAFEDVRDELATMIREERKQDELLRLRETLANALFETTNLDDLAAAVDLDIQTFDEFSRDSALPFGANAPVVDDVFGGDTLQVGEMSDLIELPDGRTVVVELASRTPAGREPLAAVSEQIRSDLVMRKARDIAAERGEQYAAELRESPDVELTSVATGEEVAVTDKTLVSRRDPAAPAALVTAAFSARPGEDGSPYIGTVSAPGVGYVVYRLYRIVPGDPSALDAVALERSREQLARQRGTAAFSALLMQLRAEADVKQGADAPFSAPGL